MEIINKFEYLAEENFSKIESLLKDEIIKNDFNFLEWISIDLMLKEDIEIVNLFKKNINYFNKNFSSTCTSLINLIIPEPVPLTDVDFYNLFNISKNYSILEQNKYFKTCFYVIRILFLLEKNIDNNFDITNFLYNIEYYVNQLDITLKNIK